MKCNWIYIVELIKNAFLLFKILNSLCMFCKVKWEHRYFNLLPKRFTSYKCGCDTFMLLTSCWLTVLLYLSGTQAFWQWGTKCRTQWARRLWTDYFIHNLKVLTYDISIVFFLVHVFNVESFFFVCSRTHIKEGDKAKRSVNVELFTAQLPIGKHTGLLLSCSSIVGKSKFTLSYHSLYKKLLLLYKYSGLSTNT